MKYYKIIALSLIILCSVNSYSIASPENNTKDSISILFLGDIMQHTRQLEIAQSEGTINSIIGYDYSSYFKHIQKILSKADLVVANLETPLGAKPFRGYPAFSAPQKLAEECKKAGIDIFLIANNHTCDRGKRGIDSTLNILNRIDVMHTGCYRRDEKEPRNPLIFDYQGLKISIINFTYGTNGIKIPKSHQINTMDSLRIKELIFRAKMLFSDIIIATPHWGAEYSLKPNKEQLKWERFLFRNGVNIIIGTHPHTPQPVIKYLGKNKEISGITAYSLGNAISNMSAPYTQIGQMINIKLFKNKLNSNIKIGEPEIIPIWCPRPGNIEKNYTIIPIKDFIGRKNLFKNKKDYNNMIHYYNKIVNLKLDHAREKNQIK